MNLNKFLDVNAEVAQAIAEGKPVVALESTIISHGMPYPQNVETALKVEQIIRALLDSGDLERVERGGYPCIRLSARGEARLY